MSLQNASIWLKSKYKYFIVFGYTVVLTLLCLITLDRYSVKTPIVQQDPKIYLELTSRIEELEKVSNEQNKIIKTYEVNNDLLNNNLKQLEKRIQAHTEMLKRMCEYIVVITVDRKILPRQCLPDYSWRREEGL